MTTPQDPRPEGQQPGPHEAPRYDPYGPRAPYNPAQGNYGQPMGSYAPQPGSGPYPGYSPYGQAPPAGYGGWPAAPEAPPKRPGLMVVSLVLLVLISLFWLLAGAGAATAVTEAELTTALQSTGADLTGIAIGDVVTLVRGVGIVIVVVALVYIALAVLAFLGRNWARIALTVLTAVFVVFLLLGLFGGGLDGSSIGLGLLFVVLPVAGVCLMYVAPSTAWFAALRR